MFRRTVSSPPIIIIIITPLFKEDNILSARTNLAYDPHKNGYLHTIFTYRQYIHIHFKDSNLKCNSHAQNLHGYVSLHICKYTQVCKKSHKLHCVHMNFIARGIFQLTSVFSFYLLSKDVYLQFLRWQNKKRLPQGVLVGLTVGLSHEKDMWKRDASSQW